MRSAVGQGRLAESRSSLHTQGHPIRRGEQRPHSAVAGACPMSAGAREALTVSADTYEVFAIRYATRDAQRSSHFIGGDPHDGPMPMDYFVWLVRNANRTFVVDTGFTADMAQKRKRTFLRTPTEGWR
jgi:hypothetical protein